MAGLAGAGWVVWRPTAAAANRVSWVVRFLNQPGCLPRAPGGQCRGLFLGLYNPKRNNHTTHIKEDKTLLML